MRIVQWRMFSAVSVSSARIACSSSATIPTWPMHKFTLEEKIQELMDRFQLFFQTTVL